LRDAFDPGRVNGREAKVLLASGRFNQLEQEEWKIDEDSNLPARAIIDSFSRVSIK
jgi:hypothetical protein